MFLLISRLIVATFQVIVNTVSGPLVYMLLLLKGKTFYSDNNINVKNV